MRLALAVALLVCGDYGVRLGVFLLRREVGNRACKKIPDTKLGREPPVFV